MYLFVNFFCKKKLLWLVNPCAVCPSYQLSSEKWSIHCQLCSTCYVALRIKNCSKSTSVIEVVTTKNTDTFCYEGKPSHATAKSTLFAVSKNEWDTKEDTGKSMKNALYILWYAKRHFLGRSDINSEKIKSVALAVIKLHLSEGISQAVSQAVKSVENFV